MSTAVRQMFDTLDVLKLEVAEEWPGLPNLILNVDGEYGTWFWTATDPSSCSLTARPGPALRLTCTTSGPGARTIAGEPSPITDARTILLGATVYTFAQITVTAASDPTTVGLSAHITFYDPNKVLLSTSTESLTVTGTGTTTVSASYAPGPTVRVGYIAITLSLQPGVGLLGDPTGTWVEFADTILVASTTLADITGYVPKPRRDWIDITGPTLSIEFGRTPLDANTLTATIRDVALDPSRSNVIRKGKPARLRALVRNEDGTTTWDELFTGQILNGKVTYDLLAGDPVKRAKITVTVVDPDTILANTGRPNGASIIDNLPLLVLAGTGVPWIVNGATDQSGAVVLAAPAAVNDQATALDQIVLTRDSSIPASGAAAYAWVNRHGQLDVEDSFHIPSGTPVAAFDETSYTGFDLSYDTDDCINDVTVNLLSIDPDTGDTITTTYGPFVDDLSKRENGDHTETYTIQGAFTADQVAAYAGVILRANAWPELRINSITVAVTDLADFAPDGKVFRDLYDLVGIANTDASIDDLSRVVGISHSITAGDIGQSKWLVTLALSKDGRVSTTSGTPTV